MLYYRKNFFPSGFYNYPVLFFWIITQEMVVCDVGEVGESWCQLDEQVPCETPNHHWMFTIFISSFNLRQLLGWKGPLWDPQPSLNVHNFYIESQSQAVLRMDASSQWDPQPSLNVHNLMFNLNLRQFSGWRLAGWTGPQLKPQTSLNVHNLKSLMLNHCTAAQIPQPRSCNNTTSL